MQKTTLQRLHRLALGAAFTGLLLPACDPNINIENKNEQGDDCGCDDDDDHPHHPKDEGGEDEGCDGGDGPGHPPGDECQHAFHQCLEQGGTKEKCAPILDQ